MKLGSVGRFYINSIIHREHRCVLEVAIAALSAYAFGEDQVQVPNFMFMLMLRCHDDSQPSRPDSQLCRAEASQVDQHIPKVSSFHMSPVLFGAFLLRQYFLSVTGGALRCRGDRRIGTSEDDDPIVALPPRAGVGNIVLYLFLLAKWNQLPLAVDRNQHAEHENASGKDCDGRNAEYASRPEHLMAASLFVAYSATHCLFPCPEQLIEGIAAGAVKG